jgi:hypothetical protein
VVFIDYDDLNVPLTEDGGRRVALIIGDGDCLHYFACKKSKVVGVKWISGIVRR